MGDNNFRKEQRSPIKVCKMCGKYYGMTKMKYANYCPECWSNFKRKIRSAQHNERKVKVLTIKDIKELNRKHGQHWFSPSTMRYFNSRVPLDNTRLINNEFFITSERFSYDHPREYSIRRWSGREKNIDTIGEFGAFKSRQQAMRKLKELLSK
jgi:hypothetical protein